MSLIKNVQRENQLNKNLITTSEYIVINNLITNMNFISKNETLINSSFPAIKRIGLEYIKVLELLKFLKENSMLVGSRYFGCATDNSDYDFLIPDYEENIKKLEEFGCKKIIDNKSRNFSGEYDDIWTSYVYQYVYFDPIQNKSVTIQVQLTNNTENKQKVYFVLKQINIFRINTDKTFRRSYFIWFINKCKEDISILNGLYDTFKPNSEF